MDTNDRLAIEALFGKLADVEAQGAPRDTRAEAYIAERVAAQPSAPYYMAQTIVVQERALDAAQQRIADLEAQLGGHGVGDKSLFDEPHQGARAKPTHVPSVNPAARERADQSGPGFLAGAAQTAMGVAGGVLLANLIGGLFRADDARAAEPVQPEAPQDHADAQDAELEPVSDDSDWFDFGGFDGGDFDI